MSNKVCLNCGKELKGKWYFCDIDCEVKHTDQLNNDSTKR
jgi:hypothetical protein